MVVRLRGRPVLPEGIVQRRRTTASAHTQRAHRSSLHCLAHGPIESAPPRYLTGCGSNRNPLIARHGAAKHLVQLSPSGHAAGSVEAHTYCHRTRSARVIFPVRPRALQQHADNMLGELSCHCQAYLNTPPSCKPEPSHRSEPFAPPSAIQQHVIVRLSKAKSSRSAPSHATVQHARTTSYNLNRSAA